MGNAAYDADQSFWINFNGVMREVAWEQLLSVAILMAIMALFSIAIGKKLSLVTNAAISIAGSFFLWPQLELFYLHHLHPRDYPIATVLSYPSQFLIGLLFLPLLVNQLSIVLVLFAWPLAVFAKSERFGKRQFGYVGLLFLLPTAWFLDCFNAAPN